MHATGEYTIADLMEVFSVGRATIYRTLKRTASVRYSSSAHDIESKRLPEPVSSQLRYIAELRT